MKMVLRLCALFALGMCGGWLSAQSLYLFPTAGTSAIGGYQTVTAVVNGVNDKTGTWSVNHGATLYGTNPCTSPPCVIGVEDGTAETDTLTFTPTDGSVSASTASLIFTASPTPLTTNPKFLFTQANLATYQAKAAASSPGDHSPYQANKGIAQSYFTGFGSQVGDNDPTEWGRTGATGWSCAGGNGQPATNQLYGLKEYDAYYYTYMALMDPTGGPTGGPCTTWKQYAYDIVMYVATQYPLVGPPYYIPGGANEWGDFSVELAFFPDWALGSGTVTSSGDKAVLATYLHYLPYFALNYENFPSPALGYNSTATMTNIGNVRTWTGNNYSMAAMLFTAVAALTFNDDTSVDPTLSNCSGGRYAVCTGFMANSLRAYWSYFTGTEAYMYWAHIDDPEVVRQAYNTAYPGTVPTQPQCVFLNGGNSYNCFGDGRGGESSEGSFYQYSMVRTRYAFNAIHTAGMDDPLLYGPQMSAGTSTFWDMKLVADLSFITGNNTVAVGGSPNYNYLTTGDSQSYWWSVGNMGTEASLLAYHALTGLSSPTEDNALKWINFNMANGGPLGTSWGCATDCGYNYALTNGQFSFDSGIDMFIALPAGNPVGGTLPSDPRPSLPTDLYNPSLNQHVMIRDTWTPSTYTLFSMGANNTMINHEYSQDGYFNVFSNGEYISKTQTQFNNYNYYATTPQSSNEVRLVNSTGSTCTRTSFCFQWVNFTTGGQMWQGYQVGEAPVVHSELPAYAAFHVDNTSDYNGSYFTGYTDVTASSRSLVYLRGTNQIVFYDRATVGHSASTQTLFHEVTGSPTISGNQAHWLTKSGNQKAYFTSLLPASATLSNIKLVNYLTTAAPYSNLQNGTTMTATCTITYKDTSTGACSAAPMDGFTAYGGWQSSDPSVATVDPVTGLITAVGLGNASISVEVNGIQGASAYGVTVVSGASSGTWISSSDMDQAEDWEVTSSLGVFPSGTPTDTRFLSSLSWGNSSYVDPVETLVQSTSGQNYDCDELGNGAGPMVCFMQANPVVTFTGTTYPASGATTHYVANLTPDTTYSVTGAGTPPTATSDTAGVLTFSATGTGNITVGAPTAAAPTYFPLPGTYTGVQSVTLATSTPGCGSDIVWNTTNAQSGGNLTSVSSTNPLTVGTTETVYSQVQSCAGVGNSPISSGAYTITIATASPGLGGSAVAGGSGNLH